MNKKPTTYILFVYGTFGETDEEVQLYVEMMGEQFFDVVSDGYLPYTLGPYHAIYKFNSVYDFADLKERIDDTWRHMSHSYFFLEMTDKMSYNMTNGGEEFFGTNIEEIGPVTKTVEKELNKDISEEQNITERDIDFFKIVLDLKNINVDLEDEDPQIKKLKQKNKKRVITIDDVLEKISSNGIDSITNEEKQILENYANGK
jgi:hypothetical protein